jgi:hypothetical protein
MPLSRTALTVVSASSTSKLARVAGEFQAFSSVG